MRLLYDISVLGLAHHHERARTGIYRVVTNVARGVQASGEFELNYYASLGNDTECSEFLAANPEFIAGGEPLITLTEFAPPSLNRWMNLYRMVTQWGPQPKRSIVCHSSFYSLPEQIFSNKRIAKVQTVHDLIPVKMPYLFAFNDDELIKQILSKLSPEVYVICMSEATRNDLLEYKPGLDPEKVKVIYSAASENFYQCCDKNLENSTRRKFAIPEHAHYLLSVSTLEPRKNIDHVVRCFLEVVKQERLNDFYLVLTGVQGWKYDAILEEIDGANEYRDRIILTGFIPDADLAPIYSGALAFVYMSLYEGFGLPPLEAMKCGTPVVVSDISSLPEVVGDAGLMIDPHDSTGLCQAMLSLYCNRVLRQEMSVKSLARSSLFSWEKCVSETLGVYREALT